MEENNGVIKEAFASIDNEEKKQETSNYVEEVSAFAEGLPSWDILPPTLLVRKNNA